MNLLDFLTEFGSSLVWPGLVFLGALLVFNAVWDELRPITTNIVKGVAQGAAANAPAYAIACLFGLSASISAFIDVFHQLSHQAFLEMSWHQYATMWAKVANPFIVAILAYAQQNKFKSVTPGGGTTPPFPPTTPPPST